MKNKAWLLLIILGISLIGLTIAIKSVEGATPYDYIKAPTVDNCIGFNVAKNVNWTYFKNMFQTHTKWILEYKRYSYSDWTNGSSYLTIQKTWVGSYWKFKLILNVPVNIYSGRFTFGIDIPCLQYINRSGTEIWINYTANATETYSCLFNYSDIANIQGLIFTHGKTNNMFWFRFQKNNILSGTYTFDPIFGYDVSKTSGRTIETAIKGHIYNNVPATYGVAYSMWAYLNVTTASHKVTLGLYTASGTYPLVLCTEEKIVSVGTRWVQFNFSHGVLISSLVGYCLAIESNATTGDCTVARTVSGTLLGRSRTIVYTSPLRDPFEPTSSAFEYYSIYVSYKDITLYSSPYPTNNSFAHVNVTLSSYCNDLNGGAFNISIYKGNYTGTLYLAKTWNNVKNDTYFSRWFNITTVGHQYKWKMVLKNYSYAYWNNYTYYFTLKFHNDTLTRNYHLQNVTGTTQYIWNNTLGFIVYSNYSGNVTPITLYENFINCSGTHIYILTSTGYKVYANVTSYNTLTFLNHYINSTGTHQAKWMGTYWIIYDNNTGNTTPVFLYNNFINSTGTHIKQLKNIGWFVWANVTGNKTVCPFQNSTNITLFENIFNATGTHQAYYNSTLGWFVYANYSGNITIVPLNNFTVGLNFTNISGYITWSGDYTSNNTNISFNVSSNMTLNGTVYVNEDSYFLAGILVFDNAQFFLMILIGLWSYFIYLFYDTKEVIFSFCIIGMGIPLGIILSGVAYYNSFPFGYLITLMVILISFLIPVYSTYQKNKTKNKNK